MFYREVASEHDVLHAARGAGWLLVRGLVGYRRGIEQHQVRYQAGRHPAAVLQSEDVCRQASHLPHRLLQREQGGLTNTPADHARERAVGARVDPG